MPTKASRRPSGETAIGSSPSRDRLRRQRRSRSRMTALRAAASRSEVPRRTRAAARAAAAAQASPLAVPAPSRRRARRHPRLRAALGDPLELAADVVRASASGPPDPWRGSVWTTRSSAGGVIGWTAEIGARLVLHDRRDQRRLARARERLLARRHLVEHAPNAKMSVRASASLPSSCSGAMYWNVPRIVPFLRQVARPAPEHGRQRRHAPSCTGGAIAFASPKSSSFTPDFVSITLPGFRSRCTIPCRCALSSASAISIAVAQRLLERQRALARAGPPASRPPGTP